MHVLKMKFHHSCSRAQVFLYDGSKSCTEWELGILGFISLCVVVLFVVPAPIAVGYICVKHPKASSISNAMACIYSTLYYHAT